MSALVPSGALTPFAREGATLWRAALLGLGRCPLIPVRCPLGQAVGFPYAMVPVVWAGCGGGVGRGAISMGAVWEPSAWDIASRPTGRPRRGLSFHKSWLCEP